MPSFWRRYQCGKCGEEFDGLHYKYDEAPYECKVCATPNCNVLDEYQIAAPTAFNKEICFSEPVKSMADGKYYTNRRAWNDHLKANGCVEIGNDTSFLNKKRELRGDFSCRKELTEATREVLSRRGLN